LHYTQQPVYAITGSGFANDNSLGLAQLPRPQSTSKTQQHIPVDVICYFIVYIFIGGENINEF